MSDLHRPDGSRADAFLSWTSPREAAFGTVGAQGNTHSNRRSRWLGAMALVCSIAIHLGLLFCLSIPLARETVGITGNQTPTASLQVRFIEMRLDAHSRLYAPTSKVPAGVQRHSVIVVTQVAPAMNVAKVPSVPAEPDVAATPAVTNGGVANPRSDDWDTEPLDKSIAGADYIQALPQGDANVMKHSTGGVTYNATRFDSSWAPDRQNAIAQAIDRATFHAVVKLPVGVQLDCAGGPSSSEPLRTSVAALAIASTRCYGSRPPEPVAAKSVIDIQTLAPAQTLAGSSELSRPAAAPGRLANKAACADTRVAAEKLPSGCHTLAPNSTTAGESGSLPKTGLPTKPLEPPVH